MRITLLLAVGLFPPQEPDASFFNGKDLTGWTIPGNPFWSVKDGAIVGRATEPFRRNEFIWFKGEVRDFYFSVHVKLSPDERNAGIQFRSKPIDDHGQAKGYQADVGKGVWGRLYHEHGRGKLDWTDRGEKAVKPNDWNHYEILAVGPRIWTAINGTLSVAHYDPAGEASGKIALQMHSGPPQEVGYKDPKLIHNPKVALAGLDERQLNAALKPPYDPEKARAPVGIHIISGSKEYKSEPSLKEFETYLEANYAVACTASWGRDGATHLEDLEALENADLLVIFTRRMKLGEEQMAIIRSHWEKGKAIVGIRTAGHAFQQADNEIFDRKVLGGHYRGHYGNEPIKVENAAPGHPVLKGVEPFTSKKLYKAGELAEDTVVLQTGDIGKNRHPVTIVHSYKGGRTFFTSLGVPDDFKDPNFRRMLVNAVFWTTRRDPEQMRKVRK